ncbi:MAG: TonB family protein [Hymenobacter sp.]|nr:MAG: TonB family protein [Hymenobacter sp.]
MRNIALIFLISCFLADLAMAQSESSRSVRGRVTNSSGKPLVGAIVTIASSSEGTPTDKNGFYLLSDVPYGATLVFSNTGYKLQMQPVPNEQKLINQQVLNASLEIDREELPPMGATAAYKAIKLNKEMPPVATLPESATQTGLAVEEKSYFPTGTVGLMHYVAHHLQYPAQARLAKVEGDVLVEFTITPTGEIDLVKLNKSLSPACDQEALRLVRQMPRWVAAKQNGQPVSSAYLIPIRFALK